MKISEYWEDEKTKSTTGDSPIISQVISFYKIKKKTRKETSK